MSLDTTEAQAEARRVQDLLGQPIDVPLNITGEQALDDLNADLRTADGGFNELRREADRAGDEIENVGDQARIAGRQLDDVGTRGGRAFGAVGLGLGALAGGIAAIGAGRLLADFFSDSIQAASDLNGSLGKTRIVFGEFSGDVEAFANTAPQALGLSEQAALEAASTFGNLFLALGLTQDAAVGMSTDLLTLAGDLASFNNLEVGDVLEKLRSGLVGETEPLRALGVVINDTVVQAKGLELGLSGVNDELTEAEKVQVRYALILEDTATAQGNFALTAGDTANQLKILKAEFETVLANVGTELLPAFKALIDAAPEFAAALEGIIPVLVGFAEPLAVVALVVADLTNVMSPAESNLKTFALQSGLAAESTELLAGAIVETGRSAGRSRGPIGAFVDETAVVEQQLKELIGASEATPRALQLVAFNLEQLAEQAGLTAEETEILADILNTKIVGQGLQSQLVDINTELDNVGITTGEVATETEGFGDEIVEGSEEIKVALQKLPEAMETVSAAFRDEENNIVADFGDFMQNFREEIAAEAAFDSQLVLLRALGFENIAATLATQGTEAGDAAKDAIGRAISDPEGLQIDEDFLEDQMVAAAVKAAEASQTALNLTPLEVDIIARLQFGDLEAELAAIQGNLRVTVPPRLPATTPTGGGGNVYVYLTPTGDKDTETARVAQTIASVTRS